LFQKLFEAHTTKPFTKVLILLSTELEYLILIVSKVDAYPLTQVYALENIIFRMKMPNTSLCHKSYCGNREYGVIS